MDKKFLESCLADESVQKTLATLSIIRDHARQIDVVKENLVEPVPDIVNNNLLGLADGSFRTQNSSSDAGEGEIQTWKGPLKQLFKNVPDSLENKLNDMAITSIQFSIDVDKSEIVNHLLSHMALSPNAMYQEPSTLNFKAVVQGTIELDSTNSVHTALDGAQMSEFSEKINALATSLCQKSLQKVFLDHGACMRFSTNSISMSSNIKPISLPMDIFMLAEQRRMSRELSTDGTVSTCGRSGDKGAIMKAENKSMEAGSDKLGKVNYPPMQKKKTEYITCTKCESPGNARLPKWPYEEKTVKQEKEDGQKITIEFAAMSEIIGERDCWDLMSREVYARALKEAAKRREFKVSIEAQCNVKPEEQPCSKDDEVPSRKVPLPCRNPCENPCKKPKEPEPCEKQPKPCPKLRPPKPCRSEGELELISEMSCSKKGGEPCKKKGGDPCKKKDAPNKKKEEPCKKKEDPCKKKEDPCKKKEDPCKKKEDPCKKNEEPCKKKEDPCKKKEDPCKKKEDPCKKDTCKTADMKIPCKKEPPCKPKEDPCKKPSEPCVKEDPCKNVKRAPKKKAPCCEPRKEPCKRDPCKKKEPCKKANSNKRDEECAEKTEEFAAKKTNKSKNKKKKALARAQMAKCVFKPNEQKPPQSMSDFLEEMGCRKAEAEKAKQPDDAKCASKESKTSSQPKTEPAKVQAEATAKPVIKESVSSSKPKTETVRVQAVKTAAGKLKNKTCPNYVFTFKNGNTAPNCKNKSFGKKNNNCDKRSYSTSVLVARLIDTIYKEKTTSIRYKHDGDDKSKDIPDSACLRNLRADRSRPTVRKDIKYPKWKNCWNEPDGSDYCPPVRCKNQNKSGCRKQNRCAEPCRQTPLKKPGCVPENPEQPGCIGSAGKKGENVEINQKYILNSSKYTKKSLFPNNNNNNNNYGLKQFKRNMVTDACESSVYYDHLKNEVAQVSDAGVIVKERRPLPGLTDYDALIRVEAVALSGSDIHVFESGAQCCQGITLGHDATGIVESVGQHVQLLKPGDKVAIESALSCGICALCKSGAYNMCSQMVFNGFLSKYQVHPADLCFKLPDGVTSTEGTLTNTLAMGCQTCFKANITPLTNLLIIGSSTTALSAAFCARAMGANNICMTCNMNDSLSMIKRTFGFDFVNYDQRTPLTQTLENIHVKLQNWPDVVINCAISEWTMNMAVMVLQPSGTCILAECDSECCSFNAMDVLMKNLKLIPSFRHTNMFPTAIYLIDRGYAPMANLVAETFQWKNVADAFRAAQHQSNIGNKKVIVKCSDITDCLADKT